MNNKVAWVWGSIGIVLLLAVGVLIDMVGSTAIRSNASSSDALMLHVIAPLVPGTQTIMRWDTSSQLVNERITIVLRTKDGIQELSSSSLFARRATVVLPCTLPEGQASVELVRAADRTLLAWSSVAVLAAGPDCAR